MKKRILLYANDVSMNCYTCKNLLKVKTLIKSSISTSRNLSHRNKIFQSEETLVQDICCSITHTGQKLKTNLVSVNMRMTIHSLYRTIKHDGGMKTKKLVVPNSQRVFHEESVFCKTMTKNRFHMYI